MKSGLYAYSITLQWSGTRGITANTLTGKIDVGDACSRVDAVNHIFELAKKTCKANDTAVILHLDLELD